MADKKTETAEPPPPPPPPAKKFSATEAAESAKKAVKDAKDGFHPLRPFKYAYTFVKGTVKDSLDGMAKWGRKGSWVGLAAGTLLMFSGASLAMPALGLMFAGWLGGLAVGAVAGGVVGGLTGGIHNLQREHRKVKYADDLVERAKAKSKPAPQADYREDLRDHHIEHNYWTDRIFQQNQEITQQVRDETRHESRGHFADMVHHSRAFGPNEQGV